MKKNSISNDKIDKISKINLIIGIILGRNIFLLVIGLICNTIGLILTDNEDKEKIFKFGMRGILIGFLISVLFAFMGAFIKSYLRHHM